MRDQGEGPRILLVDDDPTIVRLVQTILQANHFANATVAGSGREAMDLMDDVDIVLLDHQLPDSTGLEVLDAIRARPNPPAVVLVTAHGNESLAATALRRGADDYLAKDPSLPDLLPQIIERVRRTRELRKALVAAERDLVRAERLGAIGEMTVTLHHEINNPLMSAFADVELLLADPDTPLEERQESLRGILGSLKRIRDIVRQIGQLREARSKSYLDGVNMLDLGPDVPPAAAVNRGTALIFVPDEDLARIVSLLLRHASFRVERCTEVAELQAAAGRLGIALVLLIGGSDSAGVHPLSGFEPSEHRTYRVVTLVAGSGDAARAAGADHIIQLPFDPGTFTTEMINLVQ
jgi:DNA-binding response OmpR family regulator